MSDDELNNSALDASIASLKAIAGAIPGIGSILAELVGYAIPQQRLDRVADFLARLSLKVAHLERDLVRTKMRSESFIDLLEDSMLQAARAITAERREQIATVLANSISDDKLDELHKKTLLGLFGQLNDVQLIMLTYFDGRGIDRSEFAHRHARSDALLGPPDDGVTPEQKARWPIQRRYWDHLCELGLLRPKYRLPQEHELHTFDPITGTLPKLQGTYEITNLGRQLLSYAGVTPDVPPLISYDCRKSVFPVCRLTLH